MLAGVVVDEPVSFGGNMINENYYFDKKEWCLRNKNKKGEIVYCSASGCEAPAADLVGESCLPLCSVCADVWYMGFAAGETEGKPAIKYVECGCCGEFHKEGYAGDCRNDAERFTLGQIWEDKNGDTNQIEFLEDQKTNE